MNTDLLVIPLFLFQLLITIVIETLVLYKFRYHTMQACLVFASMANFLSVVTGGLLLLEFAAPLLDSPSFPWNLILLFGAQALIVEFFVLKVCRKNFTASRLVLPVLIMNLLSLIPLYFLLS
jgi:uncharacterized membrane protein (UPF0136 family)